MSYLVDLTCSACHKSYNPDEVQTYCLDCQAPLVANYDLDAAKKHVDRQEITRRPKGMWRWEELLPVRNPDNQISLGEGDTPLLRIPRVGRQLGLSQLYVKDESLNPTGSFKARGLAAAISNAK